MIGDSVHELVGTLDPEGLTELRDELRQILREREEHDHGDLIHWHTFSSLELVGVLAMIEVWMSRQKAGEEQPGTGRVQ